MPAFKDDAYSGNFPKAKRLAIARSQGKCQFCGLRKDHIWERVIGNWIACVTTSRGRVRPSKPCKDIKPVCTERK